MRAAFLDALHSLPQIECLDVGAGTGATLRRLLNSGLTAPLSLTALDRDPGLLDIARQEPQAGCVRWGWSRAWKRAQSGHKANGSRQSALPPAN